MGRSAYLSMLGALLLTACSKGGPGAGASVITLLAPGTRLVVEAFAHARLLAPGAATVLTVHLVTRDDAPLAGVAVEFVAPDRAPTGAFDGSDPASSNLVATVTDADGFASATFLAGTEPGIFLVDAVVAGTSTTITFSITVTTSPAPVLALAAVRAFLEQDVLASPPTGRALLHGPFLLPAGGRLITFFDDADDEILLTAATDTWIAWFDPEPAALFEHPIRVFGFAATLAAPTAGDVTVVDTERWPEVVLVPGDTSRALLPPSSINAATDLDELGAPPPPGPPLLASGVPFRDECIIVAAGPPQANLRLNARNVAKFFRRDRRSLFIEEKLADEPTSFAELKAMIQRAKDTGCPKVFLYITGHGSSTKEPRIVLGRDDDPTQGHTVNHSEIAAELEMAFGGTNTKVCLILETCWAERAILPYQNRGLMGDIAVSSVSTQMSFFRNTRMSYFTEFLLDCWSTPAFPGIDLDGDGEVSLSEARAWVAASRDQTITKDQARLWLAAEEVGEEHGITSHNRCDVYVASQAPLSHPLNMGPVDWNAGASGANAPVPDVEVLQGQVVQVTLGRPAGNADPQTRTAMNLTVEVVNPNVALAPGTGPGSSFPMNVEDDTIRLNIVGISEGTTRYTVKAAGRHDYYEGTGTITVKGPSLVLERALGSFQQGAEIPLSRITGGRIVIGEPGCDNGAPHLHDAIMIDDEGPFPDTQTSSCGHGKILNYVAPN